MELVIRIDSSHIIHSKKQKTVDLVSNSECEIVVPEDTIPALFLEPYQ